MSRSWLDADAGNNIPVAKYLVHGARLRAIGIYEMYNIMEGFLENLQ
jgi:hypothetical protein